MGSSSAGVTVGDSVGASVSTGSGTDSGMDRERSIMDMDREISTSRLRAEARNAVRPNSVVFNLRELILELLLFCSSTIISLRIRFGMLESCASHD